MKLKVTGGTLEVEIQDDNLKDIRDMLRKASEIEDKETKESIRSGGVKKNKYGPSLGEKSKLPI